MTIPAIFSSLVLQAGDDANYDTRGDDYDGTPTKVTPLLGQLTQGFRPNIQGGAQHQNWKENQIAQILTELIGATTGFGVTPVLYDFTTTGANAWTAPDVVADVATVIHWGGGGGGGGGADATGSGNVFASGGGGGGGSLLTISHVPIVAGGTYRAYVGASGGGGSANAEGGKGSPSSFEIYTGSWSALCVSYGGQGGKPGGYSDAGATKLALSPGGFSIGIEDVTGHPHGYRPEVLKSDSAYISDLIFAIGASSGGDGVSNNLTRRRGWPSPQGNYGGVAGDHGADDGNARGGGAGGGGGGGPAGAGGTGGTGGDGDNAGTSNTPGTNGGNASANSGGGGGGGGSAGAYAITPQSGGVGGAGGTGRVVLIAWLPIYR